MRNLIAGIALAALFASTSHAAPGIDKERTAEPARAKAEARIGGPAPFDWRRCDIWHPWLCRNHWPQAENRANPYDKAGLNHNLILAAFTASKEGQALIKELNSGKLRSADRYITGYYRTYPMPKEIGGAGGHFDPGPTLRMMKEVRAPRDALKLGREHRSETFMARLGQLEQATREATARRAPDYRPIIRAEAAILADKRLTREDKRALLSAASTMRYSIAFWTDPGNGWPTAPDGPRGGSPEAIRIKIDFGRTGVIDGICAVFSPQVGAACSIVDIVIQAVDSYKHPD